MNDVTSGENNQGRTPFLSKRIWGMSLKGNFVFQVLFSLGWNSQKILGFYNASQWDKILERVIRGFFVATVIVLVLCVCVFIRDQRTDAKERQ